MSSEALRLVNEELSWEIIARKTRKVYQQVKDNYNIRQPYIYNQVLKAV
jgi:hypothetical protein